MATPALVYLHGFRSSSRSAKAQRFVHAVAALPPALRPRLHVPDLPFDPEVAVAEVARWIGCELPGREASDRLTLVGSSLGGFYATHLAERFGVRAVVINPAVHPWNDLAACSCPQTNLHTGESFEVTAAHLRSLRAQAVPRITRPERYFLLMRSGDEVLPWREAVIHYAGAWQFVLGGGDHGWTDFADEISAVLRFAGCPAA